jgi:hypothetical protein
LKTVGRVAEADGEAEESIITLSRVLVGIAAVWGWTYPESIWGQRKRKPGEGEPE